MNTQTTTEVGIDIQNYVIERDAGIITISKGSAGNYIYVKTVYSVQLIGGIPTMVASPSASPTNINRQSIVGIREQLVNQEMAISNIRMQLNAIEADMNALDTVV